MKRRVWFVLSGSEKPRAKKSFYPVVLSVPCAQDTRSCSKCWLRCWCRKMIMIQFNFEAKNKLLQNWGACVDTVFWHVLRKVIWRRKDCRFGRNQKMYRIGIGQWSAEEYSMKMLIHAVWWSADEELPMKSGRKKEVRILQEFWWFGCNI